MCELSPPPTSAIYASSRMSGQTNCAITYRLTKSAQPAVGAAKHHRQNAYLTAIFGHYIGGYFNWMRLQSQIDCTTNIDNNTKTLAGDRRQGNSYHACASWSAKSPEVGILNEARYAGFPSYASAAFRLHATKGPGKQSKRYRANFSAKANHGLAESRARGLIYDGVSTALKIAPA